MGLLARWRADALLKRHLGQSLHTHPRLRALLLPHRRKPSCLHKSHDITSRATAPILLCQRGLTLLSHDITSRSVFSVDESNRKRPYVVAPYLYASLPPTNHDGNGALELSSTSSDSSMSPTSNLSSSKKRLKDCL